MTMLVEICESLAKTRLRLVSTSAILTKDIYPYMIIIDIIKVLLIIFSGVIISSMMSSIIIDHEQSQFDLTKSSKESEEA